MPTKLKSVLVHHSEEEFAELKNELEKSGESISNYYRRLRGLPPLKRGAKKGNQYAKGNRGRWQAAKSGECE